MSSGTGAWDRGWRGSAPSAARGALEWQQVIDERLRPAAGAAGGRLALGLGDFLAGLETYQRARPELQPQRDFNRRMVDELHGLRGLAGRRVLDLGASYCGYALERALELGAELYVGADLQITDELEVRAPDGRLGRLVHMPAERLELEEASFDLALSLSTFEHFADGAAVLRELRRVLRPGGAALVSFEPVWTASYGHHLHHLPALHRLIPPWAHLLWTPESMKSALAPRWPADAPLTLDQAVHWVYAGDELNRLPLPAQRQLFEEGPLAVEWCVPLRDPSPAARPELAEYLAQLLPWSAEELLTVGLSLLLVKEDQA